MRAPSPVVATAICVVTTALLVSGCSSGTTAEPTSVATSAQVSTPPSAGGSLPTAIATPDPGLPEDWPVAIPGYPDGRLLSAVVSEDGRNVNGSWVSDAAATDVWSAMDARLRSLGYVTSAEAGGEDLLVEDELQRSDYYVRDGYEVNLVVISGDQTTVLVNGSAL